MRGRSEANNDVELLDVELLNADSAPASDDVVHASIAGSVLAIIGVVASLGLVFFLVNGSNEPPETASPTTTSPPDTTSSTAILSDRERREEALTNLGVILGDGPALDWQPVDAHNDIAFFSHWNGTFVGDNGTTEFRVGLSDGQATSSERPSPLLDFPDHRLQTFSGERLLVPNRPIPDHVVVLPTDGGEPLRVELPDFDEFPQGDLIKTEAWVSGTIVAERFVAIVSTNTEADPVALAERTGRDLTKVRYLEVGNDRIRIHTDSGMLDSIVYADAGFTEAEVAQLQQTNEYSERLLSIDIVTGDAAAADLPGLKWISGPPQNEGGQLTMTWSDDRGVTSSSSTVDGITWATSEVDAFDWWHEKSGTQIFDLSNEGNLRRSLDDGETWTSARTPRSDAQPIVANDVIVFGRSWNPPFGGGEVVVESASEVLELVIVDGDTQFEIRPLIGNSTPVLSGYLWDIAPPAPWGQPTSEHVFTDPETGEELLRVTAIDLAIAMASASPTNEIALGHWPADQDAPEWLLAPPSDLFGSGALTVDFIAGDDQLLAIVTTVDGFDLYIADVTIPE